LKRKEEQKLYKESYDKDLIELKEVVLEEEGPEMREKMADERRCLSPSPHLCLQRVSVSHFQHGSFYFDVWSRPPVHRRKWMGDEISANSEIPESLEGYYKSKVFFPFSFVCPSFPLLHRPSFIAVEYVICGEKRGG
jgi:hypothetical protein